MSARGAILHNCLMGHFLPISFGLNTKNAPIRSCYVNIALGCFSFGACGTVEAVGVELLFVFSSVEAALPDAFGQDVLYVRRAYKKCVQN